MTKCLSFHQIILEFTDMASTQMPKNWTKISRYDKLNYFVLCGYGPGPICSNGGSYFHDQVVTVHFCETKEGSHRRRKSKTFSLYNKAAVGMEGKNLFSRLRTRINCNCSYKHYVVEWKGLDFCSYILCILQKLVGVSYIY